MATHLQRMLALAVLGAAIFALAPVAGAGDPAATPTRLLLEDNEVVPGAPVGPAVTGSPLRLTYGGAGWIMDVTMQGGLELVLTEAGPGLYEGQALVGGGVVADPWLSFDSDASGTVASVVALIGGDTAVALDDTLALREGDALDDPDLEPGTTWSRVSGASFDGAGQLVTFGRVVQPSAPATELDILVSHAVTGTALSGAQVLVSELDLVEGRALSGVGYFEDLGYARNASGQLLHTAIFAPASGTGPGTAAIVLDGVVLAETGTESILPGRDWFVQVSTTVALNDAGSWAFKAAIEAGPFGVVDVIVRDGQLVAIEGGPVPGLPGATITVLAAPRLGEDGTLVYQLDYDDGGFVDKRGIVVNGELTVALNVTPIGGEAIGFLSSGPWVSDLSDDGRRFHFVASKLTQAGWGVYEAPTGPWQDLGFGLAGTGGVAPALFGLGSLQAGSERSLELSGAPPFSATHLFVGFSLLAAPFKGGTLGPSPDLLLPGLPVDADGSFALSTLFPAGAPAGLGLHLQCWTPDAGAPAGLSASNTLVATTP
jgi:hypothetical protein